MCSETCLFFIQSPPFPVYLRRLLDSHSSRISFREPSQQILLFQSHSPPPFVSFAVAVIFSCNPFFTSREVFFVEEMKLFPRKDTQSYTHEARVRQR
jgi:hypothetical protein